MHDNDTIVAEFESEDEGESLEVRNYVYGLLPTPDQELVMQQMFAAHRYRNLLTEIERERRVWYMTQVRALTDDAEISEVVRQINELDAKVSEMRKTILQQNKAARAKSETPEQRKAIREVLKQLTVLRATARARRKERIAEHEEIRVGLAWIAVMSRAQVKTRTKEGRAACDTYWGTYLLQEQAMKAARKSIDPPKFRRWEQEGRVGVQLQHGRSIEQVFEFQDDPGGAVGKRDSQLQIDMPIGPHRKQTRGSRRCGTRGFLRMRVGSNEDRSPIWATWPLVLHRPVPPGARLKSATVSRRRHGGTGWKWQLMISIELAADQVPMVWDVRRREHVPRHSGTDGAVALNLGFCLRETGIRSGYLMGTDGYEHEVIVGHRAIEGLAKANAIRSTRADLFNTARNSMVEWLASRGDDLPEWLVQKTIALPLWRSAERFRNLIFAWRTARFPGDDAIYVDLDAWRRRECHLIQYEVGLRDKVLGNRREEYRVLASEMARRYRFLVIDDTDLRKFQRSPKTESEDVEHEAVKRQQVIANPSGLRLAHVSTFGPRRTAKYPAVDISKLHAMCGKKSPIDKDSRQQRCVHCKEVYDQDANACENLLHKWASEQEPLREAARG